MKLTRTSRIRVNFSRVSVVTGNLLILYSNPILATEANLLVRYNSCVRLLMRPSD